MQTDWEQRRQIEQRLMNGELPSPEECAALINDADEAEEMDQTIDGLERVMRSLGYEIQDVSTDDSEAKELMVVEAE